VSALTFSLSGTNTIRHFFAIAGHGSEYHEHPVVHAQIFVNNGSHPMDCNVMFGGELLNHLSQFFPYASRDMSDGGDDLFLS
jgi:hypothetical protein